MFFTDYGILDPLFTHLWTLYMALLLMQVKAGFNTPIIQLHFTLNYTKVE